MARGAGRRGTAAAALTLGVLVSALCFGRPAWANGLPVQYVGHRASILVPHEATRVGVAREVLTFDFRDASPNGYVQYPEVVASYHLLNPSGDAQRVAVAFLYLDGGGGPSVVEDVEGVDMTWQEEPLAVSVLPPPQQVAADVWPREHHWLDPATGQRYAVRPVHQGELLRAAVSTFHVEAGGGGVLKVRYRQ
ncbi:MAG TPA: hypothetical protein VF282_04170, partial [Bacillota bacterium]